MAAWKKVVTEDDLASHESAVDPHPVYVLESLIDAKGDLYAGTADNTVGRLAVGSDGKFLTADSAASTGLAWATSWKLARIRYLTSGTTYTPTAGTKAFLVEGVGPGGGGGGVSGGVANAAVAGGGAAGGRFRKFYSSVAASYAYVIGTFGAGGTAGANNGSAATATTFDGMSSGAAAGGNGRAAGTTATTTAGGDGVTPTGGDLNIPGQSGFPGTMFGTASADQVRSGQGGSGPYGAGGGAVSNTAGAAGTGYGAGGSGASTNGNTSRAGGDGSPGLIIVWEFD